MKQPTLNHQFRYWIQDLYNGRHWQQSDKSFRNKIPLAHVSPTPPPPPSLSLSLPLSLSLSLSPTTAKFEIYITDSPRENMHDNILRAFISGQWLQASKTYEVVSDVFFVLDVLYNNNRGWQKTGSVCLPAWRQRYTIPGCDVPPTRTVRLLRCWWCTVKGWSARETRCRAVRLTHFDTDVVTQLLLPSRGFSTNVSLLLLLFLFLFCVLPLLLVVLLKLVGRCWLVLLRLPAISPT